MAETNLFAYGDEVTLLTINVDILVSRLTGRTAQGVKYSLPRLMIPSLILGLMAEGEK